MEIYLIKITKPNGEERFYIGQTKLTSAIRFRQHCYGDQQLIDKKIRQYGTNNTELIVLADNIESAEELDHLEVLYIKLFESFVGWGKGGYNKNLGGLGRRTVEIDKDELQAAVDEGLSMTEMSKRFGNISVKTVAAWMLTYEIENKSSFQQQEVVIHQMIADGKTLGEISAYTNIDSGSLSKAIKAAGLKAARKKPVITTPEMIEQVRMLTAEGKSCPEIERTTGINFMTVNNIQRKLNIKSTATSVKNGATAVTPELISKITELRATGMSHNTIAREIKCSPSTIGFILQGKYDHLK